MNLLDELEHEEDFTGRVRRTKDGRPYVLANPDYVSTVAEGFTFKMAEPRGRSKIYTRCTTYVECLEDTYNLGHWQQRMVAIGMAARPSLVQRTQNVDLNGDPTVVKQKLNEIADEAKHAAGWKEKADRGTAFHDTAEQYDRGRRGWASLGEDTKRSLAAYIVATKGWEYAHIEQGMVNDVFRTYGTPDRLRWVRPRKLRVTDIKTGSIEYGWQKMELQLALYAMSSLYDPDTGIRTELDIDQEYAEVVHVPQGEGTCTPYAVPITDACEALTGLIPAVRAYRARKRCWGTPASDSATDPLAASWPVS